MKGAGRDDVQSKRRRRRHRSEKGLQLSDVSARVSEYHICIRARVSERTLSLKEDSLDS